MTKQRYFRKTRFNLARRAEIAVCAAILTLPLSVASFANDSAADENKRSSDMSANQPDERANIPATPHQQEAIGARPGIDAEQELAHTPTVGGLPATPHQMETLGDFSGIDSDRDGRLTTTEFDQYRQKGRTGLAEFSGVDLNRDGYVSFTELYYAEHPSQKAPDATTASVKDVIDRNSFKTLDSDGDGKVSVNEAAQSTILSVDDRAVYDYQSSDLNGDGVLDSQEFGGFQDALRKHENKDRS